MTWSPNVVSSPKSNCTTQPDLYDSSAGSSAASSSLGRLPVAVGAVVVAAAVVVVVAVPDAGLAATGPASVALLAL